jgi:hypothetical protein
MSVSLVCQPRATLQGWSRAGQGLGSGEAEPTASLARGSGLSRGRRIRTRPRQPCCMSRRCASWQMGCKVQYTAQCWLFSGSNALILFGFRNHSGLMVCGEPLAAAKWKTNMLRNPTGRDNSRVLQLPGNDEARIAPLFVPTVGAFEQDGASPSPTLRVCGTVLSVEGPPSDPISS